MTNNTFFLSISIVSHGQSRLLRPLINDLRKLRIKNFEVVFTLNIPDDESVFKELPFSHQILRNLVPQGFGANHNYAFQHCSGEFFAVINPDIRLRSLDIDKLIELAKNPTIGVVAPTVLNSVGSVEDSVRRFPTILGLSKRTFLKLRALEYKVGNQPLDVDWAAGMFLVFRRESFEAVCGFDHQRFFMYFEDVDICRRLKALGLRVVLEPAVSVTHDAQRSSWRSLKYTRWHLISAFRYFSRL